LLAADQRDEDGGAGRRVADVARFGGQAVQLAMKVVDEQGFLRGANPADEAAFVAQVKGLGRGLETAVDRPIHDFVKFVFEEADLEGAVVDDLACFLRNQLA
jgi:hypothetical protein